MNTQDLAAVARSIVSATIRRAIYGMKRDMKSRPERQPISYHGVLVNTRERWLRRRRK